MSLLVSEIFYSIQGEGSNVGKPAVFFRLFGCNLECKWCDSKYAMRGESKQMSKGQILKQIRKFPCRHLVITGGEPLLQQKGLAELLKELTGYYIEIETNGSIPLKIGKYVEQINCSPKLSNSGNKSYPLSINKANKKAVYKFVVRANSLADLMEVKRFIHANNIPRSRVWLMPEGVSKVKIAKASKWLIEVCKKEGFNFSPRLHVMLWGNKRGV